MSRNCPNKKPRSPTNMVEYHGKEYETMMANITPMKRKKAQEGRDMSVVICYLCGEAGHFRVSCPEKKKKKKNKEKKHKCNVNVLPRRDFQDVTCYRCKNQGHFADKCPERKKVTPAP